MIQSTLAQMEFTYLVRDYDKKGIPFRSHLHCPEVHPDTGTFFCEREDAAHVLKVLVQWGLSLLRGLFFFLENC